MIHSLGPVCSLLNLTTFYELLKLHSFEL